MNDLLECATVGYCTDAHDGTGNIRSQVRHGPNGVLEFDEIADRLLHQAWPTAAG